MYQSSSNIPNYLIRISALDSYISEVYEKFNQKINKSNFSNATGFGIGAI